jgi:hypothetical protein
MPSPDGRTHHLRFVQLACPLVQGVDRSVEVIPFQGSNGFPQSFDALLDLEKIVAEVGQLPRHLDILNKLRHCNLLNGIVA